MHENICHICLVKPNDATFILICHLCPRIACRDCVQVATPPEEDEIFLCVVCHHELFGRGAYHAIYARPSILTRDPKLLEPSNPYLSVTVHGKPQRTFISQVSVQPIIILNFVLETIPVEGSTADLIAQTLRRYHTSTPPTLRYIAIQFNLQSENLAEYQKVMESRLLDLDSVTEDYRTLVFLTTYEDNGQLFVNNEQRVDVEEFFSRLIPPSWGKWLAGRKATFWCLMSLAREKVWQGLLSVVAHLNFQHTIGFSASPFLPSLATPFFMEYAQLVLVDNTDLIHSLEHILPLANILCRHSNMILIQRCINRAPVARRLVWTHAKVRPWGHCVPIQCAKCHGLRSWSDVYSDGNGTPQVHCLNSGCLHRIQFPAPVPKNEVQWFGASVLGGRWMSVGM